MRHPMLHSFLDHLVITAPDLESGEHLIRRVLDVPMEPGGKHSKMGTHNRLLRLGETGYLEVIAIDPQALKPECPRWFQLDQFPPKGSPFLAGWIARTDDIEEASDTSDHAFGTITEMHRGELYWSITIPREGRLAFDGVAPQLIQWKSGYHPASLLPDRGCSLVRLEGFHPHADKIRSLLNSIGFSGDFVVSMPQQGEAPSLVAYVQTPSGLRRLAVDGVNGG
jgi:hypothetical protein